MGIAAQRRRKAQIKCLRRSATLDPEKFRDDWRQRTIDRLYEIKRRGKNLSAHGLSVYSIVDDTMSILKECGPEVYREFGHETYEALVAACGKEFRFLATSMGPRSGLNGRSV